MSNIMKKSALLFFGFAPSVLAVMPADPGARRFSKLQPTDQERLEERLVVPQNVEPQSDLERHYSEADTIEIIVVRHGESTWNEQKNAKAKRWNSFFKLRKPSTWSNLFKPSTWRKKDRTWGEYWYSWWDMLWFWENWYGIGIFWDAPLNKNGEKQAEIIHEYFQHPAGYPLELKTKVAEGKVVFAMSNLRRAQDTLKIGFKDVIPTEGDHQDVYEMTSLQESEPGSDASTNPFRRMYRWAFPKAIRDADFAKYDRTFQYNHRYNHPGVTGNGGRWVGCKKRAQRTLDEFFQLHDEPDKDKDIFVFAGHSHQIRQMMKLLVPEERRKEATWWNKATAVTSCHEKLENGGVMKFKVVRTSPETYQIVDLDSWTMLPKLPRVEGKSTPQPPAGLLRKNSEAMREMLLRQQSMQALPVEAHSEGANKSTPGEGFARRLTRAFSCGNRKSSQVSHDGGDVEHPTLVAVGTNPGAPTSEQQQSRVGS